MDGMKKNNYYEEYFFEAGTSIYKDDRCLVLIIYDIKDNKKRKKFSDYLSQYGERVQKSAFEAMLNNHQYDNLIAGIPNRISSEDNVRIYKVTGNGTVKCWGSEWSDDEDIVII